MKDAIKKMESQMTKESINRARLRSEQAILSIRLAALRDEHKINQSEMSNFSQTSVSRIEKRTDMKISTLVDYLDDLGMGVMIVAYPKDDECESNRRVLLKI